MREGWKEVKFETLLEIPLRNGINRPSRVRGKGFKMVNMGELFANDRLQNIEMELVQLNASEQENFQIKNFDLLFARQSIVAEGAGKCSIVLEIDNINCFESHLIRARINDKNSALFYYYLFQSAYGKGLLSTIRQQGVQAGIRGSDLQKLKIICPPLETQRKIASILSGYDDLIENNLKRIKILEEMAQQTYEEWFVRMRFPGYETAVMNEETGLPEGWEKVKLGEIYDLKYGKNLAQTDILKEGTFSVYGASGKMGYFTKSNISSKKVLVTSRGNGSGVVHRTFEDESFVTNNSFVVNTELGLGYTFYNLKKFDLSRFNSGSAQPQLTNSALLNVEIIRPNSQLINDFNLIVNNQIQFIDNLLNQNQRLREARDLLLPRLMMGIVEV